MTKKTNSLRRLFTPIKPIQAGIYHYISPPDDPRNYRLHLRLEPEGNGVLIINASTILHLNQTAAEYAYYLVKNELVEQAAHKMVERYHVDLEQAKNDYQELVDRIQTLINTPDLDPVTFLDLDRVRPFTGHITAPYRLDCALTYRLPEGTTETALVKRVDRELDTLEWKSILDKAWSAGIPHIIFTGGEPTLRDDLSELIAHAEINAQVTGLISDGLRLTERDYLDSLLQTGLDHLMIIFQPDNEASWKALENSLLEDLFVAVHLTLDDNNNDTLASLIDQLAERGVKTVSLSAHDQSLYGVLEKLRSQVADLNLELVWNLPVPYSTFNPVELETELVEQIEGEGRAWLYVEPDGDVLPAQGVNRVLGNILSDTWDQIWKG
ncbi:radical SAM/SPASM domain-containing protein [Chloroflexota bacterium]